MYFLSGSLQAISSRDTAGALAAARAAVQAAPRDAGVAYAAAVAHAAAGEPGKRPLDLPFFNKTLCRARVGVVGSGPGGWLRQLCQPQTRTGESCFGWPLCLTLRRTCRPFVTCLSLARCWRSTPSAMLAHRLALTAAATASLPRRLVDWLSQSASPPPPPLPPPAQQVCRRDWCGALYSPCLSCSHAVTANFQHSSQCATAQLGSAAGARGRWFWALVSGRGAGRAGPLAAARALRCRAGVSSLAVAGLRVVLVDLCRTRRAAVRLGAAAILRTANRCCARMADSDKVRPRLRRRFFQRALPLLLEGGA